MQLSPLNQAIPSFGSPTLEGFDTNNVEIGKRIGGSNRLYVRFYNKKFIEVVAKDVTINQKTGEVRVLKTETKEVEREMVHVIVPGDKNEVDDFATDWHRREFWPQYKAFRSGNNVPLGTAIEECTFISANVALELKYLGVHTLEQLADGSDLLCNQIPNGWELREYARAVVKANMENKGLAQVNVLKAELEKSQEMIAAMQKEMQAMQGMLLNAKGEQIPTEQIKRGPGRPAKIENV